MIAIGRKQMWNAGPRILTADRAAVGEEKARSGRPLVSGSPNNDRWSGVPLTTTTCRATRDAPPAGRSLSGSDQMRLLGAHETVPGRVLGWPRLTLSRIIWDRQAAPSGAVLLRVSARAYLRRESGRWSQPRG